ncbi:MAG: DUF2520 domain-containing protein [Rhodocyclaceae bacterium]
MLNRDPASAQVACSFVGAGQPVEALHHMPPAELWLIGTPDGTLEDALRDLLAAGRLRAGDGVFHLSGFTSSALFAERLSGEVAAASLHPVLSFADPRTAVAQFAGTLCGLEGERRLCAMLRVLVAEIGGICFDVDAARKPLYHAGSVFASNFLVVLMDLARKAYVEAGVPVEVADRLMLPLARKALDNVAAQGAAAALTGPAARGDHVVIAQQHAAVSHWDGPAGDAYASLSALALRLAGRTPP